MNVKIIVSAKKVIVGIPANVFERIVNIVADTSVIECDEIITVMVIASTKKTNATAANARSTASINCHSKKVRDCYSLHTVLFVIILLLVIIICYYYLKQKGST